MEPVRMRKRKAVNAIEDSDSDEEGFEQMDVDGKAAATRSDSDEAEARTPERSDTETEGEEEEEHAPIDAPVPRSTRSHDDASKNKKNAQKEASPPPVRELPFSKRASNPPPPADEGNETEGETDDDEL